MASSKSRDQVFERLREYWQSPEYRQENKERQARATRTRWREMVGQASAPASAQAQEAASDILWV